MSMARSHYDLAADADIVFVHNARTPADIIFRAELGLIAQSLPDFRVVAVCEADSPGERWGGYRGRLTLPMLHLFAPDFRERTIFTCGPTAYMAAVRTMLEEERFDISRYHEESFRIEDMAVSPELRAPPSNLGEPHSIQFTKSGRKVTCHATTTILEAARSAGMRLPSSCTRGLCGTCKSRLVSGKVDMQHSGGIRQREIDQGQILICCSKPLCDLVIDR
jgi:ferredoxin-NADP reductase